MSFILEALRKSESDRQRLGTVAIADLPIARRQRGQPWWVFALSGLLLVNLLVLAIVLLRDKTAPAQPSSNTNAPVVPPANIPAAAPTPQRVASAPAPSLTNNALQEAATPAQIDYETVPASELELAKAGASVPDGPTLVRPIDTLRGDTNKGSSAGDRDIANARAAQDLHLDLHVYSKNSRERFVLINMRRYTEGAQLPNGATVEQITPEGVVLNQNGSRYQLSRN